MIHLYEKSRIIKSIETEIILVVVKAHGKGKWERNCLIVMGFYFKSNGNILELYRGGGYTAF